MLKVRENYYREMKPRQEHPLLIWFLFLFTGGGSLGIVLVILLGDVEELRRTPMQVLFGLLSFLLFVGFVFLIFAALFGRNMKLILDRDLITQYGYFSVKGCRLCEIKSVRWGINATKGPILTTEKGKMKINLESYSINPRRHLILYFRRYLPEEIQSNWDQFGQIYGLRTLRKKLSQSQELSKQIEEAKLEGLVVINHKQWLAGTLAITGVFTVLGGIMAVWLQRPKMWTAAFPVLISGGVVWVIMLSQGKRGTLSLTGRGKFWIVLAASILIVMTHLALMFWLKFQFPVIRGNLGVLYFYLNMLPYIGAFFYFRKKLKPMVERQNQKRKEMWQAVQQRYGI